MAQGDLHDVKSMLENQVESLCRQLLPKGRREGRLFVANNPITQDYDHTPALKVALDRDTGAWRCYRSGDTGDILQLIAYCNGLAKKDAKGALKWARDWLGLATMSQYERTAMRQAAKARTIKEDKLSEKKRRNKLNMVVKRFNEAQPLSIPGPLQTHVFDYFMSRGIDVLKIPSFVWDSFRVMPNVEYWTKAEWKQDSQGRRRKHKDGPKYPALVSAMRASTGTITALHFTFLDPIEARKAPENPPKLIFGEAKGAMVWLSHGAENTDPTISQESHPLGLFEGIETGLSFALAAPVLRCWSVGSLSGFTHAPIEQAFVDWVMVGRDNNVGNDQAQKQLAKALDALERTGKELIICNSPIGDDFNDLTTGES